MILNLKQFEAVFCASLSYRSTIACLCKTSPVKAPDINQIKGKQVIEVQQLTIEPNHEVTDLQVEQVQQTNVNHNLNGKYHANNNNPALAARVPPVETVKTKKPAPANLITCSKLPHTAKWQSLISGLIKC